MVVKTCVYKKIINDNEMKYNKGKLYNLGHFEYKITEDTDGWYMDKGTKKLLFKFRKNVISTELQDAVIKCYKTMAKQKHPNRGAAGGLMKNGLTRVWKGGTSEANSTQSNIAGYYDRPRREHKGKLGTNLACRLTAFTLNKGDKWKDSIPFLKRCNDLYFNLSKPHWNKQHNRIQKVPKELRIPNTVFTTVTINYNWRTACHLDTGDYCEGMGNLIVVGNGWTGGWLGFPQWGVAIEAKPGDFLLMDVHQWHCNTELHLDDPKKSFRMSFVLYLRDAMTDCSENNKVNLNKIDYWLRDKYVIPSSST
jgi:hypothetical protein